MTTVLWWMIQNTVVVAVLALIVGIACRFLRHRPAIQHALWLVVLIKFVTPPIVSWPWTIEDLTPVSNSVADADRGGGGIGIRDGDHRDDDVSGSSGFNATESASELVSGAFDDRPMPGTAADRAVSSFDSGLVGVDPFSSPSDAADSPRQLLFISHWLFWAVVVGWWLGCLITLIRQLRRMMQRRRLIQRGEPAPQHVSDQVAAVAKKLGTVPVPAVVAEALTPFIWCVGRLCLVWPRSMSDRVTLTRARSILAHELAHVRRRDHWVAWLQWVAGVIWWWNPLFWLVRHRLRESAEMACDAIALGVYGDRRAYAELFLDLSSRLNTGAPVPVLGVGTGTRSSFERRLSMILSEKVSGKMTLWGILLIGFHVAIAIPCWSLAHGADGDKAPADSAHLLFAADELSGSEAIHFNAYVADDPSPRLPTKWLNDSLPEVPFSLVWADENDAPATKRQPSDETNAKRLPAGPKYDPYANGDDLDLPRAKRTGDAAADTAARLPNVRPDLPEVSRDPETRQLQLRLLMLDEQAAQVKLEAEHLKLQRLRKLNESGNVVAQGEIDEQAMKVELLNIEVKRAQTLRAIFEKQASAMDDDQAEQRKKMPALDEMQGALGEPIYNDKLKRFSFRLENVEVSPETARAFWERYHGTREYPKIVGVWNDSKNRSLIVVGPPEAEQAIRYELARLEADWLGLVGAENETLDEQHKSLQRLRRSLIDEVASLELKLIEAKTSDDESSAEEVAKLNRSLQSYNDQIETIELKLKVLQDSILRADNIKQ